jgi:transcriptional regulator with XRE-family HTH domain
MSDMEKRARGERIRALRERLSLVQDQVADAGNFSRAYMSKFENGQNAATTAGTHEMLSRGFGILREDVAPYLSGKLPLEDVLDRAAKPVEGRTVVTSDISANAMEAMKAYDWEGVAAAEYDRVHRALAQQHSADGIDRVASWWTSEIRRHLREGAPTAKAVPAAVHDATPEARDADELAAAKKAKKKR